MEKSTNIITEQKSEIRWINSAKAICMLLVYVNHCEFYADGSFFNLRPFYRLFFVNLFFLVSGYLFFKKQLTSPVVDENCSEYIHGTGLLTIKNIFYRIFLPTIVFGFIFFFPKMIIRGTGFEFSYFLKDVMLGNWSWFTSTLFVSEFLLILMFLFRIRSIYVYLAATILFGLIIVSIPHDSNDIWHWQSGVMASSLLVGGGFLWKYEEKLDRFLNNWCVIIILFIIYIGIVYFSRWQMKWFVSDFGFTLEGLMVTAIACILMVYVCKKIPTIGLLNYISKNSLLFYMLCGGYPNVMAYLCQRLSDNSTINVVASTIISILLAYVTTILINKYLPFLVDLRRIRKKA